MHIISDVSNDVRHAKNRPGGYEWWYFDAVDEESDYQIVVIFYEGNPFSLRYIRAQEKSDTAKDAFPECFPAVSISVYHKGNTVYYSFTDFSKGNARFDTKTPCLSIGEHHMEGGREDGSIVYKIILGEMLPSGIGIRGELTFKSPKTHKSLFTGTEDSAVSHEWNLVQPRAEVGGHVELLSDNTTIGSIEFKGSGYHDHNTGQEPMRDEFKNWYWGRFHFRQSSLVYYVMNHKSGQQKQAWLISNDNNNILEHFDEIELQDKGLSIFGLSSARRIEISQNNTTVTIQQQHLLDNGPFYQRFKSDAFLAIPEEGILEHVRGFTEFICPDRIYWRMFWPLVKMRIRFNGGDPHWVQKSDILYRWTW